MTTLKLLFSTSLLIFLTSGNVFSQERVISTTTLDILVNDLPAVEKRVSAFIGDNNLKPWKYITAQHEIEIVIKASDTTYAKIIAEAKTWGYVTRENTVKSTFTSDIEKLRKENLALNGEIEQYRELAGYSDSLQKGNYFGYREKMIELERKVRENELKITDLERTEKSNSIEITITEETNSTMEYSSSWVNMPGLEYSHLWIEQPNDGVTPQTMQGISLKYMFNTGKSYGVLGLYKNYGAKTKVNEAYTFAFGQDFYSRRMGRGQRKFFNLYTSFNAGVYLLTGEESRSASWFVNPYLGLELFKNKYFLIDNKVGYFLPYKDNRDLRGLLYNVSFNFVF